MPYVSEAQRRFFHAAEARGDIPKKTVREYDRASRGMDLPEKVETKKKKMDSWIGVDLDGTLAHYDGYKGDDHIGQAVGPMVNRVKDWLSKGENVKVFTARAGKKGNVKKIQDWLEAQGLPRLEVTNVKDHHMKELWDDRAVRVGRNTGEATGEVGKSDPEPVEGVAPDVTPENIYRSLPDVLGGTVRDGSDAEKFVIGSMIFDIDKARDLAGKKHNAKVPVDPAWSDKIHVDEQAAMGSKSKNPVFIASIPTQEGIRYLLIDGHHRMHKAIKTGKKQLPARVFTPEETMSIMETHPGLKDHLRRNFPEISKAQPGGSDVHVPSPPQDEKKQPFQRKVEPQGTPPTSTDRSRSSQVEPPSVNNLEAEVLKEFGGLGLFSVAEKYGECLKNYVAGDNQDASDLYGMEQIVSGIDWEMEHTTSVGEEAKELAISHLEDDPDYYRKKRIETVDTSDALAIEHNPEINKDTLENEEESTSNWPVGLNIDLMSGQARMPGYVGFDVYPYDYGTVVHDLTTGIPLPDRSVRNVRLRDGLQDLEKQDQKALLSEIQRVLMPGGQFTYEGPNDIYNYPDWTKEFPRLVLTGHETNEDVQKIEGQPSFRQRFTGVAVPDASTSNDSEPRIGIAQYDMLPADALLAMDALGYTWSDATSSGRGNRVHGYPSQGSLVSRQQEHSDDKVIVAGQQPGAGSEIEKHEIGDLDQALSNFGENFIRFLLEEQGEGVHPSTEELVPDFEKFQGDFHRFLSEEAQESQPMLDAKPAELIGNENYAVPDRMAYPMETLEKAMESLRQSSGTTDEEIVKNAIYNRYPELTKWVRKICPIKKADIKKQIIYCVVLAPEELDEQDDWMTPEDIEEAAHNYLISSRMVGKNHEEEIEAVPVESYIVPQDLEWNEGPYGPQTVKQGSWVIAIKILDPKEWRKVLDGEYQGVSVGGLGVRS